MRLLVVNAGSSSLKLRVLDSDDQALLTCDLPAPDGDAGAGLAEFVSEAGRLDAVGHRIVHGGAQFQTAVVIDDAVDMTLRGLVDLAPLHQPKALAALDAVRAALPDVPHVAAFDTAFHAGLPARARTYALPAAWRDRHGLRRFGFHGLSHAYVARRSAAMAGRDDIRLVSCHLGAGASLAAVESGRCVDTTMGFTPLEGLVMATRSGNVDPGLLIWLMRSGGISVEELERALEHESGLRGLVGTGDMREVLSARSAGDGAAKLGFDVYAHRLRASIAAMAAALGGLDTLVFTGGVGEGAAAVRAAACDTLGFLGVALDSRRNEPAGWDAEIGSDGAAVRTFVIQSREDLEIARQVRELLDPG